MASKSNLAIPPNRRPEAELLLCCARTQLAADTTERVGRVLKERIDWSYLMHEALYHGTIPLLFWNLSRLATDDVPRTTLDQLKAASNAIACWNLSLTGELLKLLNLFSERGISDIYRVEHERPRHVRASRSKHFVWSAAFDDDLIVGAGSDSALNFHVSVSFYRA